MARAPRGGSWAAEYAARITRFQREHPGASRSRARGHASAGDRAADRLILELGKLAPGSQVSFTGTDRQPDGTWRRARFDLFPAGGDADEPPVFEIPEEALSRLPEIRDAIAATGFGVLGARYLDAMAASFDVPPDVFAIQGRSGRYVSGVSKRGNALTRTSVGDALTSESSDLAGFLRKHPQLVKRGYQIVPLV